MLGLRSAIQPGLGNFNVAHHFGIVINTKKINESSSHKLVARQLKDAHVFSKASKYCLVGLYV